MMERVSCCVDAVHGSRIHFTRPENASRLELKSATYLVVLDWEEDKSLRVFLQERLICFFWLDCGSY